MKCPLCFGANCKINENSAINGQLIECETFKRSFCIHESVNGVGAANSPAYHREFNLIFEFIIRRQYADEKKTKWAFVHDPISSTDLDSNNRTVNVAELQYPNNLADKMDRILLNLFYISPCHGHVFNLDDVSLFRALFYETTEEIYTSGAVQLMCDSGYLAFHDDWKVRITSKGFLKIEELLRTQEIEKQAFIALPFTKESNIIRGAIKEGILKTGFRPVVIDEIEHNNQIVPEIFDEIDKSSFLVMDVTVPNYGAYYEAGYALGKGKQVIVCCRADAFNSDSKDIRPHFDIAQKSMIIWENEEELIEKLQRRIHITIKNYGRKDLNIRGG